MDKKKVKRFGIRMDGELERRLNLLMKKKGVDGTAIVTIAVFEMYDREIAEKESKKKA